eukprot:TRINITY_DN83334_c0_g1_i1.p1 TRINITY_DN83334_c0_g1~~TRINITY_DN83334_c0_g1_i1.p1  ORF type:complete len:481 (+),score=67.93 TRINITY_DN83334_c0_g1_i1:94-1536(+)
MIVRWPGRLVVSTLLLLLCSPSEGRQLEHASHSRFAGIRAQVASSLKLRGFADKRTAAVRSRLPTIDHWDYSDQGSSWYEIGECGKGVDQSPINVSAAAVIPNGGSFLFYRMHEYEAPIKMLNTNHGMEAELDEDVGVLAVGTIFPSRVSQQFKLVGLDFHSPSEHTYKGQRVPLELQLRFEGKTDDSLGKETAVASIGFYSSFRQSSHTLDSLSQGGLPPQPGDTAMVNGEQPASISFTELFGPSTAQDAYFYQYNGSLTAPPCSSGVHWFVRDDALPASPETLTAFRQAIIAGAEMDQDDPGNARELQGGQSRSVLVLASVDALPYPALDTVNASFDAAVNQAAEAQAAADAALARKGDTGQTSGGSGTAGTTTMQPTTSALSSATPYQVCLANLDRIYLDLKAAEDKRILECAGQVQAQKNLKAAGQGVSRLQAAKILNGQKTICADATAIAKLLEGQAATQKAQCDQLNPQAVSAR